MIIIQKFTQNHNIDDQIIGIQINLEFYKLQEIERNKGGIKMMK